jgi:hypothetical protein
VNARQQKKAKGWAARRKGFTEEHPILFKSFLGSGVLALVLALLFEALNLYGATSVLLARIVLALSGIVALAGIMSTGYFLEIPRRFRAILGIFAILVISIGLWGADYVIRAAKGRHLTGEQRDALVRFRDSMPSSCGVLVYVPQESGEAQDYGKEIQSALQAHGKKSNLIYAGAFEPPKGIVVGIRSVFDSCGQIGEALSTHMGFDLHMPARLQEGFLPYAGENTIVIFVGIKTDYQ